MNTKHSKKIKQPTVKKYDYQKTSKPIRVPTAQVRTVLDQAKARRLSSSQMLGAFIIATSHAIMHRNTEFLKSLNKLAPIKPVTKPQPVQINLLRS